ncbi:sensor histidine kinase [Aquabacterium sp. OR-4]|uniref:sensor histidine kinase n=1 Tax=Aquabacterium sp. OR-4 TaxID=2978127 RepID=UPI0021B2A7D2|nr:ATP-binding protein [Aquabacterium sp. OR-4]MDT7838555.1 DUF4118 domain-containing protein [Aquabacterium sp. OR-4]
MPTPQHPPTPPGPTPQAARGLRWRLLLAALSWAAGWAAMAALDGRVDLANLAMLLVLASAVASLWLPVWLAAAADALAVAGFNWQFVPPRGSFAVDLHQHALLLGAMLAVNCIIAALMAAQRHQAQQAQAHAWQARQLRQWSETLRDAADPLAHAGGLQAALAALGGGPAALIVLRDGLPPGNDEQAVLGLGEPDADQRAGLWHCLRQGQAMGPGTGRHGELPAWYVPLRGRGRCLGAALLTGPAPARGDLASLAHAQALCDPLGLALQRQQAALDAQRARDAAQAQGVRNALLAAISHDYRTPLATMLGAASSLESQAERLDPAQRQALARRIVSEVGQLSRLTDNTLQLARLDAPGVALRCDWESAEELVGAALRHARERDAARRTRARVEPGLPLLWCDALLMSQLLDNLIDNALKHTPPEGAVELLVRRQLPQPQPLPLPLPLPGQRAANVDIDAATAAAQAPLGWAVLAVRDRGPGVAPAWRERIFEVFQRGAEAMPGAPAPLPSRGAGVGLAVCRAIARAHGGELRLRARGHGGSSFECWLPLREAPAPAPEAGE